eukprot:TRINITY_DN1091_c0_g1_i1.p1 TRINITY_DN1091_c0_g1~~TRINITY_DN1091_c0_g1_i1.p1  ORF type:complete len:1158 (-),score=548.27 TRINITY_DN1091_c0_g1_i1:121-3594(-)
MFIRSAEAETSIQKTLLSETSSKLNHMLEEARMDAGKERSTLLSKLSALEAERAEIEMREASLKENFNEVLSERTRLEKEMKEQMTSERKELQSLVEDYKSKLLVAEESVKEAERRSLINASEFEKEKALLSQKISFYEKSLEDLSLREKEHSADLKTVKKDHVNQLKEVSSKYEANSKSLQIKLSECQDRLAELENELVLKDQRYECDRKRWEASEANLTSLMEEANQTITNLQNELRDSYSRTERGWDSAKSEYEKLLDELNEKTASLETSNKAKDEALKAARGAADREKAILGQKIEFLELQLNETRTQLSETKKAHESIFKAFENTSAENQASKNDMRQIQEIKETHRREIKALEAEFDSVRKRLTVQIETLTEKNNELELKAKFDITDYSKELQSLKEQLEQSECARAKLAEANKFLDGQKMKLLRDSEDRQLARIKALETQLEETQSRSIKEIRDIQNKSEEALTQLRNFYELEKDKLERRLVEEKEKSERRIVIITDEYETRLKEEMNTAEEELEALREELREVEANNQTVIQQLEHELALKAQQLDTLEKYARETKESLQTLQSNSNATMEQQLAMFGTERKQLLSKLETLTTEVAKKEKEIFALGQRKEHLEASIAKKETTIEALKRDLAEERSSLTEKLEEAKAKLQRVNDEYLEKKIEYGRDLALSQQQIEFQNRKITELQKSVEDMITRYEEKLRLQKSELQTEMVEKVEKLNEEKTALESKFEKNRKSLKEIESTYNKQLAALEREKAILGEKLANLESKRVDLDSKYAVEATTYQTSMAQLKEAHVLERRNLQAEIEKWKTEYGHLEAEYAETNANYERDRALWEGKFHFLESQRDQAKADLTDAQRKFELTLQHIQKHRHNDKEESENSHNAVISSIEKRYQTQIQDLTETHAQIIADYEEKIRKLERERKSVNDKLILDTHGKFGSQAILEKKLTDMMENEKKLLSDLDEVKAERDAKLLEYQKLLDQEREILKQKISECEQKFKESEAKRGTLIFEHEKDRAKWHMERDHLISQRNELQEAIERLERKKELLLRENEKLKNESRINRRSVNLANHGLTSNVVLTLTKNTLNSRRPASPLSTNSNSSNREFLGRGGEKNLSDITNKTTENFKLAMPGTKFIGGDEDLNESGRVEKGSFHHN